MTRLSYLPPSVLVLLLLIFNIDMTRAGLERFCNLEKVREGPHFAGACGNRLHTTIELMCADRRKKTDGGNPSLPDPAVKAVELDKASALSYLTKRVANRGIVCECCYHHCSRSELLQYC